jgi:hypothetical protein
MSKTKKYKRQVICLVTALFLSACSHIIKTNYTAISQVDDPNDILKHAKISLVNKDIPDYILAEAKSYNSKIKNPKYTIQVKYFTTLSPELTDKVGSLFFRENGEIQNGFDVVRGFAGIPCMIVYGVSALGYQFVGLPWWTTATVSIDAKLMYNNKEISTYHTDGVGKSTLMSFWYGRFDDVDKESISASFSAGMEEIFNQINNSSKDTYSKRDKLIEEKKKEDAEQKRLEEEREKRRQEEREEFKRKNGKYKCEYGTGLRWDIYNAINGDYFDTSCAHYLGYEFLVLQQTSDGTLAHVPTPDITMIPDILIFIEKNDIDSNLVDGARIPDGYMNPAGTYKYTNVLGSTKTVYKFKRAISD